MYERELTHRAIAAALGRSRQAVGYRLNSLGRTRRPPTRGDDSARFWDKVDRRGPDECWEWQGYRDVYGYGSFSVWPSRVSASRFAFEDTFGVLAADEVARHRCDNPPCCNPAHLERGSIIENNRDKTLRGRNAKGERHGMARYTVDQVREVKKLLRQGKLRREITVATGVGADTITTIATGRQWRGVS